MKLIVAIIKPSKFEEVKDALTKVGVQGMTVSEVRGFGHQKGQTEIYRGAEYTVSLIPKMKLEIATPDDQVKSVVDAIETSAKTGKIGDGKVFVVDLEGALRIRTGEQGSAAL
jgi:nitrogen regulatory protein P-II 2